MIGLPCPYNLTKIPQVLIGKPINCTKKCIILSISIQYIIQIKLVLMFVKLYVHDKMRKVLLITSKELFDLHFDFLFDFMNVLQTYLAGVLEFFHYWSS